METLTMPRPVVLITGGSRGIGAAAARRFAQGGWDVAVGYRRSREQAEALYAYLTEHVRYDFRYYGEPGEMPYDSTTAYGALHDNLAICGGYAQAFQLLLEQAGIPCVTVSGQLGAENHMWDLARIDGQWLYFDPTSDRGRAAYGFQCFGVEAGSLKGHTWDQARAAVPHLGTD